MQQPVRKNISDNCLAVGIPARLVKENIDIKKYSGIAVLLNRTTDWMIEYLSGQYGRQKSFPPLSSASSRIGSIIFSQVRGGTVDSTITRFSGFK
jgi:hypothetical protein